MMKRTSVLGLLCCCVSTVACSGDDGVAETERFGETAKALSSVCTAATIAMDLASPQPVGTAITLTATATCDDGVTPEFAFVRNTPGVGWLPIRGWGGDTAIWDTAGASDADHIIVAQVRAQGSLAWEEARIGAHFSLTGGSGVCNSITLSASEPSPAEVGTSIGLTALSTCTQGASPEYRILRNSPGIGWVELQAWDANSTLTWNTTDLAEGTHYLVVQARRQGSAAFEDSRAQIAYTLIGGLGSCTSITEFSTDPPSPQNVGAPIELTAQAACTQGASPEFQYWLGDATDTWYLLADWAPSGALWDTSTLTPGSYSLVVVTRRQGSSVGDAWSIIPFALQ